MKKLYPCYMCNKRKIASKFYLTKSRITGISSRCISCEMIYKKSKKRKQSISLYRIKYTKIYAVKVKARRTVSQALKNGIIFKSTCRDCQSKDVEAHHFDYSLPLDVVWLCSKHHARVHYPL